MKPTSSDLLFCLGVIFMVMGGISGIILDYVSHAHNSYSLTWNLITAASLILGAICFIASAFKVKLL